MILRNERLAKLVLEVYLERVKKSSEQKQTRHTHDLEHALSAILSQREQDLEVLLFLDALDEYNGPPEMIAEFVQSLVQPVPDSKTKVKLLISSCPWDEFVARFGQQPGFKIHEQTKSDMRIFVLEQLGTTHATAQLSSPAEDSLDRSPRDIASVIVNRAEGVFLWVRLVVDSLRDASPNAATLQLEEILQRLPDGLEELYERAIDRIPRSFRLEAFIALEIVNRPANDVTLRDLTLAAGCALGKTLEECIEMVKKRLLTVDDERDALQQKNLRGGLIEVKRDSWGHASVQFIHQTVKDFVSRPGFEHRTLSHSYAPLYENGFSFQMKYLLAMYALAFSSDGHHASGFDLTYATRFARRAEETTGNSQERFFDSIGDERVQSHFVYNNDFADAFRPLSVLSCAVVSNLLRYLREKLRNTTVVDSVSQKSLLYFAVEAVFFDHPALSLASMIELLLGRLSNIFAVAKVAEAFMMHEQHANVNITFDVHHPEWTGVCQPLNVARFEVSKALLKHGAHINDLDSEGRTALDRVIWSLPKRSRDFDYCHTTASILLEYGGCITHFTKMRLPDFVSRISLYSSLETPDNVRNPPELSMTLTQRVRSVVPSYLGGYMTSTKSR